MFFLKKIFKIITYLLVIIFFSTAKKYAYSFNMCFGLTNAPAIFINNVLCTSLLTNFDNELTAFYQSSMCSEPCNEPPDDVHPFLQWLNEFNGKFRPSLSAVYKDDEIFNNPEHIPGLWGRHFTNPNLAFMHGSLACCCLDHIKNAMNQLLSNLDKAENYYWGLSYKYCIRKYPSRPPPPPPPNSIAHLCHRRENNWRQELNLRSIDQLDSIKDDLDDQSEASHIQLLDAIKDKVKQAISNHYLKFMKIRPEDDFLEDVMEDEDAMNALPIDLKQIALNVIKERDIYFKICRENYCNDEELARNSASPPEKDENGKLLRCPAPTNLHSKDYLGHIAETIRSRELTFEGQLTTESIIQRKRTANAVQDTLVKVSKFINGVISCFNVGKAVTSGAAGVTKVLTKGSRAGGALDISDAVDTFKSCKEALGTAWDAVTGDKSEEEEESSDIIDDLKGDRAKALALLEIAKKADDVFELTENRKYKKALKGISERQLEIFNRERENLLYIKKWKLEHMKKGVTLDKLSREKVKEIADLADELDVSGFGEAVVEIGSAIRDAIAEAEMNRRTKEINQMTGEINRMYNQTNEVGLIGLSNHLVNIRENIESLHNIAETIHQWKRYLGNTCNDRIQQLQDKIAMINLNGCTNMLSSESKIMAEKVWQLKTMSTDCEPIIDKAIEMERGRGLR